MSTVEPGGEPYLEKREEVDHYMEVINHLSTQALTPDRTARFLNEITRET